MIFMMILKSIQVFDETHHGVVKGKVVQRANVRVVKMLVQVLVEVPLYVVRRTAKSKLSIIIFKGGDSRTSPRRTRDLQI